MTITIDVRQQLYRAGYDARTAELSRASAVDSVFMEIMQNRPGARPLESKEFMEMCGEWYEGYDHCADDIVAIMFEDDEYFQEKAACNKRLREARLMRLGA